MGLKRAIEALAHDRTVEATARQILEIARREQYEWFTEDDFRGCVEDPSAVPRTVALLVDSFVLDSDDDATRFRLAHDPVLMIEIDRFLQRAARDEERVQTNVARFRKRYNCP